MVPQREKGRRKGVQLGGGQNRFPFVFPSASQGARFPPFWPSSLFPPLVLGKWEGESEERAAKGDEGRLAETLAKSQTSGEIKSVHI